MLEACDAAARAAGTLVPRAKQRIRLGRFCYSTRMVSLDPSSTPPASRHPPGMTRRIRVRYLLTSAWLAQVAAACRTAAGQTLYVTVVGYAHTLTAPIRASVANCSADLAAAAADV